MKLKKLIILVVAATSAIITNAQDCDIRLGIAPIEEGDNISPAINSRVVNYLTQAVAEFGVTADPFYSQFFITGRFDHSSDDVLPGLPTRYVLKTTLTLMIGDAVNEQVYATTTVDLTGVGDSKDRAYINALSSLPSKRSSLASFIETAKTK
ncbi:MAG: hypothetical protein IJS19_08870, partial [Muribaculaceae bacterium]|nr:hypothetical protein [Muribaculaceae bacterium]